jgi:hypothetical protein
VEVVEVDEQVEVGADVPRRRRRRPSLVGPGAPGPVSESLKKQTGTKDQTVVPGRRAHVDALPPTFLFYFFCFHTAGRIFPAGYFRSDISGRIFPAGYFSLWLFESKNPEKERS